MDEKDDRQAARWADLPKRTQAFIAELRDDDINALNNLMHVYSTASTVGGLLKWMVVTFIGAVVLFNQFGEALSSLWYRLFAGAPK